MGTPECCPQVLSVSRQARSWEVQQRVRDAVASLAEDLFADMVKYRSWMMPLPRPAWLSRISFISPRSPSRPSPR